ncbi:MAG: adenylyltransferase/cytidyltransferase family protein [Candidatus Veblenbacteria bacterium]|nr:adenylyltransferase/cytidyltransferase family protein [Candidatus Veblenbacteria bacterium]MDZ4229551.1 adenylyltransferase/cytidyltransferase family protein [Candidatus Veblenbacteria bacterium]
MPPAKLQRVLAFGTFDLLHAGHLSFLRQARKLGRELYAVVARDKNSEKLKGRKPLQNENARLAGVSRLPFVTKALLGQAELSHRYQLVREIDPDVIALGYDQFLLTTTLEQDLKILGLNIKLVRLKPYRADHYKSSILRAKLESQN